MIDLEVLKSKGVSSDDIKKIFDGKRRDELPEKVRRLVDRIRDRLQGGINDNLTNYKVYHALDLAWDVPFRQVSATLLGALDGKDASDERVLKVVNDFGLTSLIELRDTVDPKTGRTQPKKVINTPVFFQVTVPLVRSYVTIRWAKITNDRKLVPFFKYEPTKDTPTNRLRCEVITDRVQTVSTEYGYFEVLKQAVFHMLHYSFCLQFPVEEWHSEEQVIKKEGKVRKAVVKEGLRYHLPHPTRTFWDKNHRISTFNTDSGCEFAGYWRVIRYGDIVNNSKYWNTDKVSIGSRDWINDFNGYFLTVAQGCTMQFPQSFMNSADGMQLDREVIQANRVYTSDLSDAAVTLTEYFEKLIPSEYGLGDYDHPVWFRFVIASDDTIIYCAPLPYAPVVYYGYDAHEGRAQNASLSLEVQPFQDQVSNLLSQLLLSTKQNLANANFVDTDQVDEKDIERLEGWGERLYRSLNFIRFSSRKWRSGQQTAKDAFQSVRFPQLDTTSIVNAIKIVLDVLERTLVMSSQEVAQAATHEQTREEVKQIASTASSRLTFTAMPVDSAIHAWKKQLYQGLMAYGEEESYVQVEGDTLEEIKEEDLKKLGFTIEEKATKVGGKAIVKTSTAIELEAFASTRDGEDRVDNVAAATSMSNFLIGLLNNPLIAPAIGAEQAITMLNLIARLAGFPRDFKLRVTDDPKMREQQQAEAQNELKTMCEQIANQAALNATVQSQAAIMQQVGQSLEEVKGGFRPVVDGLKAVMDQNKQQDVAIAQIMTILDGLEKAVHIAAPQQPQLPLPPGMEGQGNVINTPPAVIPASPAPTQGPPQPAGVL